MTSYGRGYGIECYCDLLVAIRGVAVECETTRIWSEGFIAQNLWGIDQILDYSEEQGRYFLLNQRAGKDLSCSEINLTRERNWTIEIGCLQSQKDVEAACLIFDLFDSLGPFQVDKATYYCFTPSIPIVGTKGKFTCVKMQMKVKVAQRRLNRDAKLVVIPGEA